MTPAELADAVERADGADRAIAEMDAWCVKQIARLRGRLDPYIMAGGDLDDPEYRHWHGQHAAFMRMRSFLHGSLRSRAREG